MADVITALTAALRKQGVDAGILMPGYPSAMDTAKSLRSVGTLHDLPGGPGSLLSGVIPDMDVPVILLDTERFRARTANPYVDQYGGELSDNAISFAALAHTATRICAGQTVLPAPHVVQANDWHAGLIPALLRTNNIQGVGAVMTIHNLAFQGNFPIDLAPSLGLPPYMLSPDCAEYWGQLSFLKAGIRYADRISTVSHTYAQEILTPRFGHGFEGLLNQRKNDLTAIPNGIDVDVWDPRNDQMIVQRFERRFKG
ncbi:glycogen synthase [Undibacterium arcticum]|uniref:glycogen synthase n=1 Tax=Undibacterium arcticum TaxID=1762892 RepID=UPI003621A19D